MISKQLAHGAATLVLGWLLALSTFFVGLHILGGLFMAHDLPSLLSVTAIGSIGQFLLCALLVSHLPQGSIGFRATVGAVVGLATAIVPVLLVNALVGGGVTGMALLFKGIGAVFLAMFCVSGLVFGASLARITSSSDLQIYG